MSIACDLWLDCEWHMLSCFQAHVLDFWFFQVTCAEPTHVSNILTNDDKRFDFENYFRGTMSAKPPKHFYIAASLDSLLLAFLHALTHSLSELSTINSKQELIIQQTLKYPDKRSREREISFKRERARAHGRCWRLLQSSSMFPCFASRRPAYNSHGGGLSYSCTLAVDHVVIIIPKTHACCRSVASTTTTLLIKDMHFIG